MKEKVKEGEEKNKKMKKKMLQKNTKLHKV